MRRDGTRTQILAEIFSIVSLCHSSRRSGEMAKLYARNYEAGEERLECLLHSTFQDCCRRRRRREVPQLEDLEKCDEGQRVTLIWLRLWPSWHS